MAHRTLAVLISLSTVLSLSACGIERRQDRREDRREERKDLVLNGKHVPAAELTLM
jgi:hypothetical protein